MRSIAALAGIAVWALFSVLAQSGPPAADPARFHGTWVKVESQSTYSPGAALLFRRTGDGGLEEVRGEQAQVILFDGQPYPVAGTKTMIAWRKTGPRRYERTRILESGRRDQSRTLELSADGSVLTETIENRRSDGSVMRLKSLLRRKTGNGLDLTGEWTLLPVQAGIPDRFTFEAAGSVLRRTAGGQTVTFPLDGSFVPVTMPGTFEETTLAMRLLEDGSLEQVTKYSGTPCGRAVASLSPDGRTLTMTLADLGPNATPGQTGVLIYRKE